MSDTPAKTAGGEEHLELMRDALSAAPEREMFPAVLPIPTAPGELEEWLRDDHQWLSGRGGHWVTLLDDLIEGIVRSGPGLQQLFADKCEAAQVELAECRGALKAAGRRPPDLALRQRLGLAAGDLRRTLTSEPALLAAWDDHAAVSDPDQGARWAEQLMAVWRMQGHQTNPLLDRVKGVLEDRLVWVKVARDEKVSGEDYHRVAGLSVHARLALARRALTSLPRDGHAVYWFKFSLAPLGWPWVLPVGDSVCLFQESWLREAVASDMEKPSGIELPPEVREPRGEQSPLRWLWGDDDETDSENPQTFVRVDLGHTVLANAEQMARETAHVVVAMASLHGALDADTWLLEQCYVRFVDRQLAGFRAGAHAFMRPNHAQTLAMMRDRTGIFLEEEGASLGAHLPVRDAEVREATQLLVWMREIRRTWGPGRLVLLDRVFEQVSGWAGVDDVGRFVRDYLRLPWIYRRMRDAVSDAALLVADADPRRSARERSKEYEAWRELVDSPELGLTRTAERVVVNLQAVLTNADWILTRLPPGSEPHRAFTTLRDRTGTGKATLRWVTELGGNFDALERRARRTRNALVHGGPVAQDTVERLLPFIESLAADALYSAVEGRLKRRDLVRHFIEVRHSYELSLRQLKRGVLASKAFFWES